MIHDLIFFAIDIGTTWTQEMVWCIMNNLDFKTAKESILEKRVPYFEYFVVIFNNVHILQEIIVIYVKNCYDINLRSAFRYYRLFTDLVP